MEKSSQAAAQAPLEPTEEREATREATLETAVEYRGKDAAPTLIAGKYQVIKRLGAGGMGAVYEAKHLVLGRHVAVKVLRTTCEASSRAVKRFWKEARIAGAVQSEFVVGVLDSGISDDGTPYLAMELLDGSDLRVCIKAGRIEAKRALSILIDACRGVAAVHAKGIVHRDLKPENLFLCVQADGGDLCKVLDFGIAKMHTAGSEQTFVTGDQVPPGTLAYMAPEQLRREVVTSAADVYALGVIAFELLVGRHPFRWDAPHTLLYDILNATPEWPEQARSRVSQQTQRAILSALAKNPAERITLAQLTEALHLQLSGATSDITASLSPARARRVIIGSIGFILCAAAAVIASRRGPETAPAPRAPDAISANVVATFRPPIRAPSRPDGGQTVGPAPAPTPEGPLASALSRVERRAASTSSARVLASSLPIPLPSVRSEEASVFDAPVNAIEDGGPSHDMLGLGVRRTRVEARAVESARSRIGLQPGDFPRPAATNALP
jgi:serine/threonine-protein kinase